MGDYEDKRKADGSADEHASKRQRRFADGPADGGDLHSPTAPIMNDFANLPPPVPFDSAQQSHAAMVALQAMAQIRARLSVGLPAPAPAAVTTTPQALVNLPNMETIVLDCPKAVVGLVIGRGGDTIKQFQEQSGARVQIDQNVPAGEPCKITISGIPQAVQLARGLVEEKIRSDSTHSGYVDVVPDDGAKSPNDQRKEVMDIPQPLVGKMIGRGGETIRTLQVKSKCNITIDQNFPDGHARKMTIIGTPENVEAAIAMVKDLMHSTPDGGGDAKVIECDQGLVGRIIGRGGETIRMLQQNSGARITIDQNFPPGHPRKVMVSGRPDAVETATRMIEDLIGGGSRAEEVIPIDRSVVGRIIGKGGETIKALQQQSGARIQVDQTQMRVTISGDPRSIERGKQMVHAVLEGNDPFAPSSSSNYGGYGSSQSQGNNQQWGGYSQQQQQQQQQQQGGAGYDPYAYQQWWYQQQQQQQGGYGGQQGNGQRKDDEKPPGLDDGSEAAPPAPAAAPAKADVAKAWQIHYDDQQRPYYWNSLTGASSWEKPSDMAS